MDLSSNPRRKALFASVCALCSEAGFQSVDKATAETITELLQSFLTEIGRSSRAFCELAGRTEPLAADVVMALVEMGQDPSSLPNYARRPNRLTLIGAQPAASTAPAKVLQVGQKRNHPPHIPDHFPQLPDPHAYIRTATFRQPLTEYPIIREKAANQKRDLDRNLTRVIAKTGDTHSLFHDDDNLLFPLVACTKMAQPYLSALLPRDQIFDYQDEEEQEEANRAAAASKKEEEGKDVQVDLSEAVSKNDSEAESIDNPFLRPPKIARKKNRR